MVQPKIWIGPDSCRLSPILRLTVVAFPPAAAIALSSAAVDLRPVPLTGAWAACGSDVGGRHGLQQAQGHFGICVAGGTDGMGGIVICK